MSDDSLLIDGEPVPGERTMPVLNPATARAVRAPVFAMKVFAGARLSAIREASSVHESPMKIGAHNRLKAIGHQGGSHWAWIAVNSSSKLPRPTSRRTSSK